MTFVQTGQKSARVVATIILGYVEVQAEEKAYESKSPKEIETIVREEDFPQSRRRPDSSGCRTIEPGGGNRPLRKGSRRDEPRMKRPSAAITNRRPIADDGDTVVRDIIARKYLQKWTTVNISR